MPIGPSLGPFIGHVVDRVFGEPPNAIHPLIAVGNGLTSLETRIYRDDRMAGAVHVGVAVVLAFSSGQVLRRILGRTTSDVISVALCSGGAMLWEAAANVGDALERGDIVKARELLPMLVGRDPSRLDESEISRAVIESVAENTVDAVTSTLWWGLIGGAPLVAVHRVTNTLDAMVGHRNERYARFGWAAARLDDALNWIPARLTAAAIAVVAPKPTREVLAIVRRDGSDHPSPNGGQVEAATAGALGISLGGSNNYGGIIETRGSLGDGPPATPADIGAAIEMTSRASWVVSGALAAVAVVGANLRSHVTVVGDARR